MNTTRNVCVRAALAATLLLAFAPATAPALGAPLRVIVAYESGQGQAVRSRLAALGAHSNASLPSYNAVAVSLPPGLEKADVAAVPGVRLVEEDGVVSTLKKPAPPVPPVPAAETVPWGVDRIEADAVWSTTSGDAIKVAVIDTGIDATHPDLADNLMGGYNAINPAVRWTDDNGHGTHVAGIIAAADNSIGVVGVAPSADLYAVKALNRRGSGYTSDIIEGIDWAIANGMQVINMSLGSTSYSSLFEAACTRAIDAGIVVVAAAGNAGPGPDSVTYPALYPGVIGVSATDSADAVTIWSSCGPGVDLAAPGASIYSTYKGGGYTAMDGTSMASPHVAGVAALVLAQNAALTPAQVEAELSKSAEPLGDASLYGAGLVRADRAVLHSAVRAYPAAVRATSPAYIASAFIRAGTW